MESGLFEAWLRTASAIVRPGGGLALIARPQSLGDILAALRGRFGAVSILPVHPRVGEAAIRIVLRAVRGSRAGLTLAPPLVLHEGESGFSPRAEAAINGQAALFGA
jgi:tRNA1(Val) A37 N6-methylase TrmN6